MVINKLGFLLAVAGLALTAPAIAEQIKKEGVIVTKSAEGLQLRTREGPLSVALAPGATIKEVKGALNKQDRGPDALIPGLIITVHGEQQANRFYAEKVEFKERDWRAAVATKAGTAAEFAELRQAIIDGQEYVIREETTVYFKSGNATVAEQYKQQLRQIAGKAKSFGNYRISILGFADPRGNAEANERLSQKRALAVSNYVRQTGLIEPGRVLSPSAMGEGTTAPGEAAPANNDEARRVVVRIVTPKGQLQN